MVESPETAAGSTVRLAVGVLLLVAGVVLWLLTGKTWLGIVSGIGVVVLYTELSPRIESWRSRP